MGVTYTTAAQLNTLNQCDLHLSIDISDAYHSLGTLGSSSARSDGRSSRREGRVRPGQPKKVTWIDALVNGCTLSTFLGGGVRT